MLSTGFPGNGVCIIGLIVLMQDVADTINEKLLFLFYFYIS